MKKIITPLIILGALILPSCQPRTSSANEETLEVATVEAINPEIIENFFTDFQNNNEGWTKTTEGHDKLKEAFKEKMLNDIEFAKAVASYGTEYKYVDSKIRKEDSISPYEKADGEEGEIKAFEFIIPVTLTKPLYNGQKEIKVSYEIISMIPSTVEEHWRPYIGNVKYCAEFSPYFKSVYDGVLNLGCFIISDTAPQQNN